MADSGRCEAVQSVVDAAGYWQGAMTVYSEVLGTNTRGRSAPAQLKG